MIPFDFFFILIFRLVTFILIVVHSNRCDMEDELMYANKTTDTQLVE